MDRLLSMIQRPFKGLVAVVIVLTMLAIAVHYVMHASELTQYMKVYLTLTVALIGLGAGVLVPEGKSKLFGGDFISLPVPCASADGYSRGRAAWAGRVGV
jgi:hypothetical protein